MPACSISCIKFLFVLTQLRAATCTLRSVEQNVAAGLFTI